MGKEVRLSGSGAREVIVHRKRQTACSVTRLSPLQPTRWALSSPPGPSPPGGMSPKAQRSPSRARA